LLGDHSDNAAFAPAYEPAFGDPPIAVAQTHAMNHVTVLKHFDPPIGHGSSFR
jgi:hypothetical protein